MGAVRRSTKMAIWQGGSTRMPSGGRRKPNHKKRRTEIGREEILATLGPEKHRPIRSTGGNQKMRILTSKKVNVTDPTTGKTQMVEAETVTENPANVHYVRRNILTRGAVVQTKLGKARITSRPGQAGQLNAVLIKS